MEIQTLDARYIDGAALLRLLVELFGLNNFKLDVGTLIPCTSHTVSARVSVELTAAGY